MTDHRCDLCHSDNATPIAEAKTYMNGHEPPVVCQDCGFVYVRERRSSADIAADWDTIWGEGYSSSWPMVRARLYYVAEWFEQHVGWKGKSVLDIGAGEGDFLDMVMERGGQVTAVEPAICNVRKLIRAGIAVHRGPIESFPAAEHDVVSILWTLENCGDCIGMLERARECVGQDGRIVVATGSRLMVPFKKPLGSYFSKHAPDLHSFRFSNRTLAAALRLSGWEPEHVNYFRESDWLVMTGVPCEPYRELDTPFDDPKGVMKFFENWRREWP